MNTISIEAIQDYYPDDVSHCYGCGKLNEKGYQLKSFSVGEETLARFTPKDYHTAIPGFVYGGLLASLVDCHGTGTAAIAAYRNENRPFDSEPKLRFVTASLKVDYLKPTPLGPELIISGKVKEIKGRKVVSEITISVDGDITVKGEVVAVQMPESMGKK
jgi:acyl-coenzyme A thioesterase PaaI-like protein